jgi:hypothetical protein
MLLVAALVVVTTAGCGGASERSVQTTAVVSTIQSTNPTGTAGVTTHGKYRYPPVVVNNFMSSCTNENASRRDYCACTLDELTNEVSVEDFARIGLAGGKLPPRIQRIIENAAVECADKL